MTAEPMAQAVQTAFAAAPPPRSGTRVASGATTDSGSDSGTWSGTDVVREAEAILASGRELSDVVSGGWQLLGLEEATVAASRVEELSRTVQFLQLALAGAIDRHRPAKAYGSAAEYSGDAPKAAGVDSLLASFSTPSGSHGAVEPPAAGGPGVSEPAVEKGSSAVSRNRFREFRSTADFLRARLRISRSEARRRLELAGTVLPPDAFSGAPLAPAFPRLSAACAAGDLSAAGVELIAHTLQEAQPRLQPETLAAMEQQLTDIASRQDHDFLVRTTRHWLALLDQEQPPSEEELARFQGIFPGRRRNGLSHLHIYCTDAQHEALVTAMNSTANPRTAAPAVQGEPVTAGKARIPVPTRPQRLLDGLLSAVRAALAAGGLPASGGLRPQVMVTMNYESLMTGLAGASGNPADRRVGTASARDSYPGFPGSGLAAFSGPIPAEDVRQLACDAELIPAVLGEQGQVLDLGRAARLFPPHIRKALLARDLGCAFPGCTVPGPWTEAHHITFWENGGSTGVGNGALLCSFHHHLIHQGNWTVSMDSGIPWFTPPPYVDPDRKPLRNSYFHPVLAAGSKPS